MSELIDRREFPEVLPCPFCGGKVELHYAINYKGITEYYIACRSCCYMNFESSIEKAVSRWNTRHYPPEVQQAVERMKPKRPIFRTHEIIRSMGFFCPDCNLEINQRANLYSCKCGQRLDWSE